MVKVHQVDMGGQEEEEEEVALQEGRMGVVVGGFAVAYVMEEMEEAEAVKAVAVAKVDLVAGEAVALSVYMFKVLTLLQ